MRRKGHPSFPSAMTCCFFASLKTLLIPTEAIAPLDGVNVLALSLAGFQVTLIGRFWVIPEARPTTFTGEDECKGVVRPNRRKPQTEKHKVRGKEYGAVQSYSNELLVRIFQGEFVPQFPSY